MATLSSPSSVALTVNGRPRSAPAGATVADLVAELAASARALAVERNGEIVPRARWSSTPLASGDRVEIVRFVQGG